MASIDGRAPDPAGKSRSGFFTNLGPKTRNSWLGKNWHTVALVLLLVVLAFFVRSYFAYSPSVDNGYLVSGGSDSYYHERVIGYVEATGQHLFRDPMLNYPIGMRNPRLPLYDWSVAVTSMVSSAVTGTPLGDSTGMILVMSTANWFRLTRFMRTVPSISSVESLSHLISAISTSGTVDYQRYYRTMAMIQACGGIVAIETEDAPKK
jgi:hypothetical protein